MGRAIEDDRGVVLVMIALVMAVLMGLAALGLDLSVAMNKRRVAQNATDNAVLVAAWASCHGEDPFAAADLSVTRNGFDPVELTLVDLGSNTFEATINTSTSTFFGRVLGFSNIDVTTTAGASCAQGASGGGNAIFATGTTCPGLGKRQVDISGSTNRVSGGVHSNANIVVDGSNNNFDYDPPDPPANPVNDDPFTHYSGYSSGGSGNIVESPHPTDLDNPNGSTPPLDDPLGSLSLSMFAPGGSEAGGPNYYYVNGDIKGDFIQNNGDGIYYATGNIELDKTVTAEVTLVSEGWVKISASNQVLTPRWENLLVFAGQPYSGVDQCDKFVVSMSGSDQNWTGIIYGPNGLIEMSGSTNTTFTGSLIGFSVRLNGSEMEIIANPDFFSGGEPFVRLDK